MKLWCLLFVLTLAWFILGCGSESPETNAPETIPASLETPVNDTVGVENASLTVSANTCVFNSNCTQGSYCIDQECRTISSLYRTGNCTQKCNFNNIVIETSDNESYTLARGQGSYTAAGALEWKILPGPLYCKGSPVLVPISIIKRNYGEIYGDEVITLNAGNTSKVITHPLVKRVAFTLKVKGLKEECS